MQYRLCWTRVLTAKTKITGGDFKMSSELRTRRVGALPISVGCRHSPVMEMQKLNNSVAVGLVSGQSVVVGTHLVPIPIEEFPSSAGEIRLRIDSNRCRIRPCAVFEDACWLYRPTIRCSHDRNSSVERHGGRRMRYNTCLSSTIERYAVNFLLCYKQ